MMVRIQPKEKARELLEDKDIYFPSVQTSDKRTPDDRIKKIKSQKKIMNENQWTHPPTLLWMPQNNKSDISLHPIVFLPGSQNVTYPKDFKKNKPQAFHIREQLFC